MPGPENYDAIFARLHRPLPTRTDPGEMPHEAAPDMPHPDALIGALRTSPFRTQAMALALAGDLVRSHMNPELIVELTDFPERDLLSGVIALRLARFWGQMHDPLWAWVHGDSDAWARAVGGATETAHWGAGAGHEQHAAHHRAPGHTAAVQTFSLMLLEFASAMVRSGTEAEQRSQAGQLMGSYLLQLLRDLRVIRMGRRVHAVEYGQAYAVGPPLRMISEWWAYANRRMAVREGLGVELE